MCPHRSQMYSPWERKRKGRSLPESRSYVPQNTNRFRSFRFATAAMALWCGIAQLVAAQNTPAKADASKSVTPVPMSSNLGTKSTASNMPSTAVKNVLDPQPPISCKVGAKGVLTDCRVNVGYNLNDVANWFQDDHDRTLQLAADSLALAKRLERSSESCGDGNAKKK